MVQNWDTWDTSGHICGNGASTVTKLGKLFCKVGNTHFPAKFTRKTRNPGTKHFAVNKKEQMYTKHMKRVIRVSHRRRLPPTSGQCWDTCRVVENLKRYTVVDYCLIWTVTSLYEKEKDE